MLRIRVLALMLVGSGCSHLVADEPAVPLELAEGDWIDVSVRGPEVCALGRDGRAFCYWPRWGAEWHRRLSSVPEARRLTDHDCVVDASDRAFCPVYGREAPALFASNVQRIVRAPGYGPLTVCVLDTGGLLSCGAPEHETDPYEPGLVLHEGVIDVASNGELLCALVGAGAARCWDAEGLEGPGTTVEGLGDVVTLDAGGQHWCSARRDGTAVCWGRNHAGQLGIGVAGDDGPPSPVFGIGDAVRVVASHSRTCAVHRDGRVSCWGITGLDLERTALLPEAVLGVEGAIGVGGGDTDQCAVESSGRVVCWGGNHYTAGFSGPAIVPGT